MIIFKADELKNANTVNIDEEYIKPCFLEEINPRQYYEGTRTF